VPPTDDEWANPRWEGGYTKHHPVQRVSWEQVVESTGLRGGRQKGKPVAKYGPHPSITVAFIEQIEMAAVRVAANELLPRVKPNVRAFWSQLEQSIGASDGEVTDYIYVEWHLNGSVHGRPMTRQDLIRRGMPA
jgi:hypothetical protein